MSNEKRKKTRKEKSAADLIERPVGAKIPMRRSRDQCTVRLMITMLSRHGKTPRIGRTDKTGVSLKLTG